MLGLECLFGWLLVTFGGGKKTAAAAPAKAPAVAAATEPPDGGVPAWRMRAVFGLAAAMFVVFLVSPPVYLPQEAGVVMSLPEEVKLTSLDGGHFYGSAAPVSDVEHRLLPKDTLFERKTYTDYHEHQIFFSIVLSGLQQYTIHPPEVCLVAQGWRIVGQEDVPIQLESGHRLVVRNLSLQRDVLDKQQQRHLVKAYYMYWYVADDLTTPSHLERTCGAVGTASSTTATIAGPT
ncbi:MAG: exosortase-associated EpsI family protein [Verrucomicrobiota bacterium]